MNQVVKWRVYGKGNDKDVAFISKLAGLTPIEDKIFKMTHEQTPDLDIQIDLGLDKKTYAKYEESISHKLSVAVFYCIHYSMEHIEL